MLWTGAPAWAIAPVRLHLRAARVRHHRRLPPVLLPSRLPHQPRLPVRPGRNRRHGHPEGPRSGGRAPTATTTPTRTARTTCTRRAAASGTPTRAGSSTSAGGGTPTHLIPDFARYPELVWLNRLHFLPPLALAVACYAVRRLHRAGLGLRRSPRPCCGTPPTPSTSLSHLWGTQRYETGDDSRNNPLLALITFGEGWHNNHHHYMASARQGFRWWEIDITYYILRALAAVGLIWDLREPPGVGGGRGAEPRGRPRRAPRPGRSRGPALTPRRRRQEELHARGAAVAGHGHAPTVAPHHLVGRTQRELPTAPGRHPGELRGVELRARVLHREDETAARPAHRQPHRRRAGDASSAPRTRPSSTW